MKKARCSSAPRPIAASTPTIRGPESCPWGTLLPAPAEANPITYLGNNGSQYVVVDAGDPIVAFRLP